MSNTTPLDIAKEYKRRLWAPIPVPFRSKNPDRRGWQNLIISDVDLPRYFNGHPQNFGLLNGAPSNNRVDVDLDCKEAVKLAPLILPKTDCIFGRAGKRSSHYYYEVDPLIETEKFLDTSDTEIEGKKKRQMLVEIRSTGTQTIAPGSIHEDTGEPIQFEIDGDPAKVDGQYLNALVAKLSAATLLARHWPGKGARHHAELALAGGLLRAGWAEEDANDFIVAVAEAGGGELGKESRKQVAADTGKALADGRKATGWKTLIEIMDAKTVGQAKTWLGITNGDDEVMSSLQRQGSVKPAADLMGVNKKTPKTGTAVTVNTTKHEKTVFTVARGAESKIKKDPVPDFKPFPVGVLPQTVRDYIQNAAETVGCDSSYIALPLFGAFAQAIGNTRRIKLKRGWYEPCILWLVIVGDSGTLKSPAVELGTKFTRHAQERMYKDYQTAQAEYCDAHKKWKAAPKDTKSDEPEAPAACNRVLVSDTTFEALCERMLISPRGLLLCRDELAGWFMGFNQYKAKGGSDVANSLEMFGGRSLTLDRKTGTRTTTYIPRASVSITGGIQPATLRQALQPEFFTNGLAARLFFAYPPRRPKRWTEDEIDPVIEDGMNNLFESLFKLTGRSDLNGNPEPIDIPLDFYAKSRWIKFVNDNGDEQFSRSDEKSIAAWSKLEGGAARLALIIHQIRVVCGDTIIQEDAIDLDSLESGISLAEWFGYEAERIYSTLQESEEERADRTLAEYIAGRGAHISASELMHANRKYRPVELAEERLQELVDAGFGQWIMPEHTQAKGRPSDRFFKLSHAPRATVNTNYSEETPITVTGEADFESIERDAVASEGM